MNDTRTLSQDIEQACKIIAPLWPLTHFVAVNPFLGYADRSFAETALHLKRARGCYPLPPKSFFKSLYQKGAVSFFDLSAAIQRASDDCRQAFSENGAALDQPTLLKLLDDQSSDTESQYLLGTFSAFLDRREGERWNHLARQEAAKWCAAHFDRGQSLWRSPWHGLDFFTAWKQAARLDRTLQLSGVGNAAATIEALPESPLETIELALRELRIPPQRVVDILEQAMLELPGWSGYLRYLDREKELRGEKSDNGVQLLAVLMAYELILYRNFKDDHNRMLGWQRSLMEDPSDTGESGLPLELAVRLIWQSAVEIGAENAIRPAIQPGSPPSRERPDFQAVFCIDVRSERFRRALESSLPRTQTIGFAGFFGVPAEHHLPGEIAPRALCPALLAPPVKTSVKLSDMNTSEWVKLADSQIAKTDSKRAWRSFKESAASCFSFVETLGLSYARKLIHDSFGLGPKESFAHKPEPKLLDSLALAKRIELAANFLKGAQLADALAPLVLICGHGSSTANNPYASGLDCGACGGHAGDTNARLAAALLNDPQVRSGLAARQISIPGDVHFVAGIHNTTTDEVTLFDLEGVPAHGGIEALQRGLAQAGHLCRIERAATLGESAGAKLDARVLRRSLDWSQPRPEWGLAGNQAFIVAPRAWTQKANLDGKAFLHEYNPSKDPDLALLEGILAGPLVVGSWINLQYFASAANNEKYGSGHKAVHNVIGGIGAGLGNDHDLKVGLAWQSVHDGKEFIHTPCRLHACVAAEPEELERILGKHKHLRDLVSNNWIHLIALGRSGQSWQIRTRAGEWSRHPATHYGAA